MGGGSAHIFQLLVEQGKCTIGAKNKEGKSSINLSNNVMARCWLEGYYLKYVAKVDHIRPGKRFFEPPKLILMKMKKSEYLDVLLYESVAGNSAVIRSLLEHTDANGRVPKDSMLARFTGLVEGMTALHALCKNLYEPDHPLLFDHMAGIRYLIAGGADVTLVDSLGNSALHYAASLGAQRACEYLIDAGADIDLKNSDGDTPLHLASKFGYRPCVSYLISRGANSLITNASGRRAGTRPQKSATVR